MLIALSRRQGKGRSNPAKVHERAKQKSRTVLPSPRPSPSISSSTIVAMADNRNSLLRLIWRQRTTGSPRPSAMPATTLPRNSRRAIGGSGWHEPAPVQSDIPVANRQHTRTCRGTAPRRSGSRPHRDDGRTGRTHRRGGRFWWCGKDETGVYPDPRTSIAIDQASNSELASGPDAGSNACRIFTSGRRHR